MNLSEVYNPYDFANPVSEVDLLVGREKQMDEIKYYLNNAMTAPRPINIALLGQRASGKTSILNITELEAKARGFLTVRINLDEDDARSQLAFLYKLFDSILSAACESGAFGGIEGKTYDLYLDAVTAYAIPSDEDKVFCPFLFPIQYAKAMNSGNTNAQISDHTFRSDLVKVHHELKVPIVLLLDEGNVLAKSRVLLQKLRHIFMNTPGFMLVMTGTPELFPLMDEVFSPIGRQFKKINVGEFGEVKDTLECIKRPLEKLGFVPERIFDFETYRDVKDIHNVSGGRPYEIQLICHLLFRRVQSRRAEKMKLDFSVLEEVRREFEMWEDIRSRPILTKVRNLNKQQLEGLGLLCSCDHHATFNQIWELEYIFNEEANWTKDALQDVFQLCINEGILLLDNDLIMFAGDDFDKIYTKYFAGEQGIEFSFSSVSSIKERWQRLLSDFFKLHLEDRLEVMFLPLYTDIVISDVINKMGLGDSNEDVFVDNEELCFALYIKMVVYRGQAILPILVINPCFPWLNAQLFYCAEKPDDSEALKEGIDQLGLLNNRIAMLGGNLALEKRNLPIVSLESLVDKVRRTANKHARYLIGVYHFTNLAGRYFGKSYDETSALHGRLYYTYNPDLDAEMSNIVGYMLLSADDLDMAEVLFKRSVDLYQSTDSISPRQLALPTYNLGIVKAHRKQFESALADFQTCINYLQDLVSEQRSIATLWVPVVFDKSLAFTEQDRLDLLTASNQAKAIMEYMLALKDGDNC